MPAERRAQIIQNGNAVSSANPLPVSADVLTLPAVTIGSTPALSGASQNLTLALSTSAAQVPAGGSVPTSDYVLVIHNADASIEMFWNFANSTTGGISLESGSGKATFKLAANQVIYVFAASGTPTLNYTTKEI